MRPRSGDAVGTTELLRGHTERKHKRVPCSPYKRPNRPLCDENICFLIWPTFDSEGQVRSGGWRNHESEAKDVTHLDRKEAIAIGEDAICMNMALEPREEQNKDKQLGPDDMKQ